MNVFIVDDYIYIIEKKIINYKFKSISKGYIINKDLFMEEFLKMLKKENIKLKLLGNIIKVLKNSYFKEADLFYMENIFNELGFLKVEYININDILNDKASYIEVNNSYMVINLEDGIYLDLSYYKDIPRILTYFDDLLNDNIIFFGLNKNIPLLKIDNKNIYYIANFQNFIPESLLKTEK